MGDDIWHLSACPKFHVSLVTWWPRLALRLPKGWVQTMRYFCLEDRPDLDEIAVRAVVADLCVKSYQSGIKGPKSAVEMEATFEARIRKWSRLDKGAYRKAILNLEGRPACAPTQ